MLTNSLSPLVHKDDIYAGAGNDSVVFGGSGVLGSGNTYFFGASDGADTLSFGSFTAGGGLTIAVDAAYGATSGFDWSAGAFNAATATVGTMNMGSGETARLLERCYGH